MHQSLRALYCPVFVHRRRKLLQRLQVRHSGMWRLALSCSRSAEELSG